MKQLFEYNQIKLLAFVGMFIFYIFSIKEFSKNTKDISNEIESLMLPPKRTFLKALKMKKWAKIQTLVNDGWVKNTFFRLQTPGFSVLQIYKVMKGSGGKF